MTANLVDFDILDNEEAEIEENNENDLLYNNEEDEQSYRTKEGDNMIRNRREREASDYKNEQEDSSYHNEIGKFNIKPYDHLNENSQRNLDSKNKNLEYNFGYKANDENTDRNRNFSEHNDNYFNKSEKIHFNPGEFNLDNPIDKETLIINNSNNVSQNIYEDYSRASFVSLTKDLEDKWETIEKVRKNRSRKPSNNIDWGSSKKIDKNKKSDKSTNYTENINQNSNQDPISNLYNLDKNLKLIEACKIKCFKGKEDNEFELFVENKFIELEKIKKNKNNSETETINNHNEGYDSYNEDNRKLKTNGFRNYNENNNLTNKTDPESIVYNSNSGIRNKNSSIENKVRNDCNYNNKPSFLKSNVATEEKKNLLVFRGNTFNYINNNNNLDQLIYETGQDKEYKTERNLQPSVNLISKMQNIFGILTQTHGMVEEKNDTGIYLGYNKNHEIAPNNTDNQSINNINNLEKNFENIFTIVSPNYKNIGKNYRINNFKNQEKNENFSEFDNDPLIQKKLRILMSKNNIDHKNINSGNSNNDKIKQKIGENHSLLNSLFQKNLDNKKKEQPILLNSSKNHTKNFSLLNQGEKEKIYSQNNFSDLMNKVSKVNSVKIKKILNLHE